MVSHKAPERKDDPEYGLQLVHRLAGFQQVLLTSSRIQKHVFELGYELEDVCDLLGQLNQQCHFHHSERYRPDGPWHDVYRLEHPVAENPNEKLYIKFRVNATCILLELCSFHPEGWQ